MEKQRRKRKVRERMTALRIHGLRMLEGLGSSSACTNRRDQAAVVISASGVQHSGQLFGALVTGARYFPFRMMISVRAAAAPSSFENDRISGNVAITESTTCMTFSWR